MAASPTAPVAKFHVFYMDKLIDEFEAMPANRLKLLEKYGAAVYNRGYMYITEGNQRTWWRLDLTPMLDSEVPRSLKAWVMLLNQ